MTGQAAQSAKQKFLLAFILIVSLFFAWGVANSLNDILIPQFKKAFVLTDLQTALVQSAFYGGYFLLAMPAAMFSRRSPLPRDSRRGLSRSPYRRMSTCRRATLMDKTSTLTESPSEKVRPDRRPTRRQATWS